MKVRIPQITLDNGIVNIFENVFLVVKTAGSKGSECGIISAISGFTFNENTLIKIQNIE